MVQRPFQAESFRVAGNMNVNLMNGMNVGPPVVKLETTREYTAEDFLEEEYGPLSKRSRSSFLVTPSSTASPFNQWSDADDEFPISPSGYNPLAEPSPLGLSLRKSPSLLDLIQMRLSEGNASSVTAAPSKSSNPESKKDAKTVAADKLKAANFPALHLRIGDWEYMSRYEGDLVAKCYFAKHKLVWEVLEGGLKSKIEIQWSDILALKADCPDDGPSTLTVVLARQPQFFRETNPQPRKHTLWQATSDFTDGQASLHRQHFLQCQQGVLNKHYEKLIQCDMRLNFISRQKEVVLESPYFETEVPPEHLDELGSDGSNQLENARASLMSGVQDLAPPGVAAQSSSLNIGMQDCHGKALNYLAKEAPSPSSVMDGCTIEGNGICKPYQSKGQKGCKELNLPGIHPSMSKSDLVHHFENCISEKVSSGNMPSERASECQDALDNIADILLGDTQSISASDEKSLMKKVNSLCCLLQDPPTASNPVGVDSCVEGFNCRKDVELNAPGSTQAKIANNDIVNSQEHQENALTMSRKDSFADFLQQLPRIASLSRFLYDIAEDDEN